MVLMLKIINDLIHCIIQLMLLRRREDGDNSILFMTSRRVAADNDSSPCRPTQSSISSPTGTNGAGLTAKLAMSEASPSSPGGVAKGAR
jgi:hypothetical protein